MVNLSNPDLSQHPPRSLRVRIGGYAHLGRLLDKARATIAGKAAEYHYNCPLDQLFFTFTGIDHEAMLAEIKSGKTDVQILEWVNTRSKRQPWEIATWSSWVELRGPGGAPGHEWIAETLKGHGSERDDIRSFADLLDLDDYLSYGGKA
jgi:hypothetical protein